MIKLNIPVEFINHIAKKEANDTKFEFIEPEHLFIGLCSIDKLIDEQTQRRLKISNSVALELANEWRIISSIFQDLDLKISDLRREIRKYIGTGTSEIKDSAIKNSKEAIEILESAKKIAQDSNSTKVNTLHLLLALIEQSEGKIVKFLNSKDIDIELLKQNVTDLIKKREIITPKKKTILERFGRDLVKSARDGQIKEAIGDRAKEAMQRIIQILSLEQKNNPILIGEAGVGKTAIVEGLAWRIAHADEGKVPEYMRHKKIIQLSITDLLAGTKYRGDIEDRVRKLIQEMNDLPDVILFIDEIHTIVGAGATGDAMDIGNMLKPALARGDLRCIGATTSAEYYKYFSKDSALERRFQVVLIREPNKQETLEILTSICDKKALHHKVEILAEALNSAVELSGRYFPDRNFPDKAIDILETACAMAAIPDISVPIDGTFKKKTVNRQTIIQVISKMTDLPLNFEDVDKTRLLDMANQLKKRVIGQDEACEIVSNIVINGYSGLRDPNAPLGVILFIGPTGVGKTELAKATTEFIFGNEKAMHRFDMTEYHEAHSLSKLIGSPPGYVGYEEEGQLTSKLRRKPFSVVLLDEIEKAHRDVLNLFLQVFDDGRITDSKGRTVDATHALFILTSNIKAQSAGLLTSTHEDIRLNLVNQGLPPEFVNRIDDVVSFSTFTDADLENIANLLIRNIAERFKDKNIQIKVDKDVLLYFCQQGYTPQFGARPMKRIIERSIGNLLSTEIIDRHIKDGDIINIMIENDKFVYKIEGK
ncbi:MAG: AAA family ATPase [Candidatus Hodarchaeota archaeon]